ncbi:hypothetical protein BT96DRAFT_947204 [Gymnopus androsaceus JB14]|uniref:Uncharacterized protein n=1 Tax=Gymnopus androsaceus JB14 TaxID=1447944 RepID=A0A6A4GTI6_9AGAR|nr:hypothetical protein BT96DRAFT_947204 [Gymnopus androsaceus JB14]
MTSTNSTYRAQCQTFRGPSGFINSLAFHISGRYLACASEDHTIRVYDCKYAPKTIWTHRGSTAYTFVIWTQNNVLVGANTNGKITTFKPLQFLVRRGLVKVIPTPIHEFVAPVGCISLNKSGQKMLVCAGEMVNVLRANKSDWILKARLSCPGLMPKPRGFQEPPIIATGAHFLEDDSSCIVAYLHHGLWKFEIETGEGAWCWGPDEKIALVAVNMRSDIDWYRLSTTRLITKASTSMEIHDTTTNFQSSVLFINKGRAVLMGTNKGYAVIFHSEHGGRLQTLAHGDKKSRVTALAYVDRKDRSSLLATAEFIRGGETVIRVWTQEGNSRAFPLDSNDILKAVWNACVLWPMALFLMVVMMSTFFMFASLVFWILPANWREAIITWFWMIQFQTRILCALITGKAVEDIDIAFFRNFGKF